MCKRRNSTNKENLYQIKFVKAWFEQCYSYDKKSTTLLHINITFQLLFANVKLKYSFETSKIVH